MDVLTKLIKEHIDIFFYLFFGVCTTAANVITYWMSAHICNFSVMTSTVIAWITAVAFAYITNRKWVFHSEAHNRTSVLKELVSFYICRGTTGILDLVCMYVFVQIFKFDDVLTKFLVNILVIILNYLASKIIVFKHST